MEGGLCYNFLQLLLIIIVVVSCNHLRFCRLIPLWFFLLIWIYRSAQVLFWIITADSRQPVRTLPISYSSPHPYSISILINQFFSSACSVSSPYLIMFIPMRACVCCYHRDFFIPLLLPAYTEDRRRRAEDSAGR